MYGQVLGAILRYMLSQDNEPATHCHTHATTAVISGATGVAAAIFKLMIGFAALLVWLGVGVLGALWQAIRAFRRQPVDR